MAAVTICSDFGSPQNSLSQFHLRRLSYLSLLFSESLHSDEYIFPFFPCLLLFFFPQLFVKLPQTTILSSCISFSLGGFDHCFLYNVMNLRPQFFRHSVYQIQSLEPVYHLHCIVIKDLIQVIPECSSCFPYFLQFKSEFGNKEFMIQPQ